MANKFLVPSLFIILSVLLVSNTLADQTASSDVSVENNSHSSTDEWASSDESVENNSHLSTDETSSYHVSIQNSSTRLHICNGVIHKTAFVITAAKCVQGITPGQLTIYYGSKKLADTDASTASVQRIYVHPRFNASLNWYDLAILYIGGTFDTSARITLPKSDVPLNQTLVHSGWKIVCSKIGAFYLLHLFSLK